MQLVLRPRFALFVFLIALRFVAGAQPDAPLRPDRNRPGPWNNDVLVYHVRDDGTSEKFATFERAGVPTVTRLKDGRLIAAHQHFPEDNDADFDKVAVRFSSDEGKSWTAPKVIRLTGLPDGMRFPFDPTLVALPDGRVRLYFTSVKGRRIEEHQPAIYSAISSNGLDYVVEPGQRFGVDGRIVIDCAVVLHDGVFHLFAPDNGKAGPPNRGPEARRPGDRPQEGVAYHATGRDGLKFTRDEDVKIDGRRRWLGNAQSDGKVITFFGTGEPGVWSATSPDGKDWKPAQSHRIQGADPGVVKLKDGSWLLIVTGPPRSQINNRN